ATTCCSEVSRDKTFRRVKYIDGAKNRYFIGRPAYCDNHSRQNCSSPEFCADKLETKTPDSRMG
ncbi:hypothetical protein GBA52_008138, partial [Prunus armeniaca]